MKTIIILVALAILIASAVSIYFLRGALSTGSQKPTGETANVFWDLKTNTLAGVTCISPMAAAAGPIARLPFVIRGIRQHPGSFACLIQAARGPQPPDAMANRLNAVNKGYRDTYRIIDQKPRYPV